jgi:hypothetical protein
MLGFFAIAASVPREGSGSCLTSLRGGRVQRGELVPELGEEPFDVPAPARTLPQDASFCLHIFDVSTGENPSETGVAIIRAIARPLGLSAPQSIIESATVDGPDDEGDLLAAASVASTELVDDEHGELPVGVASEAGVAFGLPSVLGPCLACPTGPHYGPHPRFVQS